MARSVARTHACAVCTPAPLCVHPVDLPRHHHSLSSPLTVVAECCSRLLLSGRAFGIFELISATPAIYIAVAVIEEQECAHAIVYDGWRRLLFIGPGNYTDRTLDGTILIEQDDIDDRSHVSTEHECTLTEYVRRQFGIMELTDAHVHVHVCCDGACKACA
jgi:hypothetical protein